MKKVVVGERKLTSKELDVLKLLYRFRFATSDHIAAVQGVHRHSARLRAARLRDMGYLRQKRDSAAMMQHKPAIYALTSKGATYLKQQGSQYNPKVLRAIVASAEPSEDFIDRNLAIFSVYNRLKALYEDKLLFLTKSGMSSEKFEYLPEVKPDAFIQLGKTYFFLYYLSKNTPDFAQVRRFKPLFDYENSGLWENTTSANFPKVLFVADTKRLATFARKRFLNFSKGTRSGMICATTTFESLMSEEVKAWESDGQQVELTEL